MKKATPRRRQRRPERIPIVQLPSLTHVEEDIVVLRGELAKLRSLIAPDFRDSPHGAAVDIRGRLHFVSQAIDRLEKRLDASNIRLDLLTVQVARLEGDKADE